MLSPFRFFARLLDTLNIAACLYDENDKAVLWNRSFFKFFPEHVGHIYEGEPYQDNLRRFYNGRLAPDQLIHIERYIEQGIARHHTQTAAFTFCHRGIWIKVSSLPFPKIGRLRAWVQVSPPRAIDLELIEKNHKGDTLTPQPLDVALIDDIADGVSLVSKDGRIVSVNDHFLMLYGFADQDAIKGRTFTEIYNELWTQVGSYQSKDDVVERSRSLEESIRFTGAPFEVVLPGERWTRVVAHRAQDGTEYWLHTDISQVKLRQKELEAAEQRARSSEALYRLLADYSRDVIIGLDATSYVRYVSPSVHAMLGYLPDELLRQSWHELPLHRFDEETSIINCDDVSQTFQALHKDGNTIWIETSVNVVPSGSASDDIRYVIQLRNVSARKEVEFQLQRANSELAQLATVDSLTTLSNRYVLVSTLEKEWKRARRECTPLSVLMFDIDNFKTINDRFGHQTGDECLIKVAEVLKENCRRPADLCARYGGEEFIIVLPSTEQSQAQQIAERILRQMRQISIIGVEGHTFSVSIGLATTLPAVEGEGWSELIHAADEALYIAKRTGKDRLVVARLPASEVIVLQ